MNRLTRCQRLLSSLQCLTNNRPRYPGISLVSLSASLISSPSAAQLESETENQKQTTVESGWHPTYAPSARDPGVSRHRRDSESEGKQEGGGWEKLPSADTAHNKEVLRLAYQQA